MNPQREPLVRREFAKKCAVGATALALLPTRPAIAAENKPHPVAIFAKHAQHFEFDELARRLKAIGVDGIEATLRKGGQIAPPQLESKLGGLCDALAKQDQRVIIAASDINEANDDSEKYLAQLAKHGVPYFRMAYYRYDFSKPILPQLAAFAKTANELAEMASSLGVMPLYQNHAGERYCGGALWDLQQVLAEIPSEKMAVAFDCRHAALELSSSYTAAYHMIRPHIGAIYVKDFDWKAGRAENVPLGEGLAKPVFDLVKRTGLIGPLSLHMEYFDHNDPQLAETCWTAISEDVDTLREWLA